MTYRPLTLVAPCPKCKCKPLIKWRWFRGWRAECPCGISGPFVRNADHPNEILAEWNTFIRPDWRLTLKPPPPGRRG